MNFKELRERRKQKQEDERREMLDRVRAGEPPKSLREVRDRIVIEGATEPRIVTCPQGVVVYTIPDKPSVRNVIRMTFDFKRIDEQIKDVLAAAPDADLKADLDLQRGLGIKILSVRRNKPAPPSDEDPLF